MQTENTHVNCGKKQWTDGIFTNNPVEHDSFNKLRIKKLNVLLLYNHELVLARCWRSGRRIIKINFSFVGKTMNSLEVVFY